VCEKLQWKKNKNGRVSSNITVGSITIRKKQLWPRFIQETVELMTALHYKFRENN